MIKINRPAKTPSKLAKEGTAEDLKNRAAYDNAPLDYDTGTQKFKIQNGIYGDAAIKSVLKRIQNDKCCFCEKDQVEEFGAVEHFRPKNGYKSSRNAKLKKPGYYWIGYNWDNLFFVCGYCNSAKYKGNLFPLVNEAHRAKSHHDDINSEVPYLINPALIEPRDHIFFKNEFVSAKTVFGSQTISICGLDRETLNDKRRELIDNLESKIVILAVKEHVDPVKVQRAKDFLKKSVQPGSPFSAAAIDYLSQFKIQQT